MNDFVLNANTVISKSTTSASSREPRLLVTMCLVAANILIFAAMGFPLRETSKGHLLRWGADWGPLSLHDQPWRIVTSMFVHDGVVHILANMVALWIVGRMAERLFGKAVYAYIYVASGIAGDLLTLDLHPEMITCGASAAILGVLCALIVAMAFRAVAGNRWPKLLLLILFAAYWLYSGWHNPHIDNASHYGAAIAGAIMGFALSSSGPEKSIMSVMKLPAICGVALFVIAFCWVQHKNGYVVAIDLAERALSAGDVNTARTNIEIVLQKAPRDPVANFELGEVCIKVEDYGCAEAALKIALSKDPTNNVANLFLGKVFLKTGRADEALRIAEDLFRRGAAGKPEQMLFADSLKEKKNYALAGSHYLSLNEFDAAVACLEIAFRQNPLDVQIKSDLVRAYRGKGMESKARELEENHKNDAGASW